MKYLRFAFLASVLALLGCNDVDIDENKLAKLISSGDQIVSSLERFKESTGRLPDSLEHLVTSGYLKFIPDTDINGRRFRYVRFKPLDNQEYRISVGLNKPKIGSNTILELTFRSDGMYGSDSVVIHRRIGRWVIQTTYR